VLANRSTIDYSSGSPPAEKSTLWVDFNIDASVVMPNRHYNTEGAGQYDNSNYPIVIKVIIIPKFVNNATYPTAIHMNRIDWELDYIP
jgi:hypothetical protein